MALLVALRHLDGFINLAFAQGARHRGCEGARLLAGGAERHVTIDHHADRPARHDEQDYDHDFGQQTHRLPHIDEVPAHLPALLEDHGGESVRVGGRMAGRVSGNDV